MMHYRVSGLPIADCATALVLLIIIGTCSPAGSILAFNLVPSSP